MYTKTYQAGFIIPPIIIILGIVLAVGVGMVVYQNRTTNQPATQNAQESTSSANPQQSATPSPKPTKPSAQATGKTPTPKPKTTIKPTSSPTPVINPTTSNPYDLTSATGSVKVMVKPSSGSLAYIPQAELAAVSGFKVLDGRSTDKITQFGPNRTDELRGEIVFSTAPPGPYKVRISYGGSWSDQKDVTVSSAKQSYVEFTVAGVAPTPTPTPIPKTSCQVNILSKSSESAPSTIQLSVGAPNIVKPANVADKYITEVKHDYGDGTSAGFSSSLQGIVSKTYNSAGSYTIKAQVKLSDGEITDECSSSFTLN